MHQLEVKTFRHEEKFDQSYGTKESTKPTVMIDTLDRSQIQEPSINSKSTDPPKKRKIKRRCDKGDIFERQKEEFGEKIENLHKV